MKFIVKRYEVWEQDIEIDAKNEDEALRKAEADDGMIRTDPQFKDVLPPMLWRVVRVTDAG